MQRWHLQVAMIAALGAMLAIIVVASCAVGISQPHDLAGGPHVFTQVRDAR